ncbi:hypothetical protein MJO28_009465, partial [Puccinia striiformis f. sp. tritici]
NHFRRFTVSVKGSAPKPRMVAVSMEILFCVILQNFGVVRLALLPNLDAEAHVAQSSKGKIQKTIINEAAEQLPPKEYGVIPSEPSKRKEEAIRMRRARTNLESLINLLEPRPGTEFSKMKSEFEQLHFALRGLTTARVYRLSGLNPSFDTLFPKLHSPEPVPTPAPLLTDAAPPDVINHDYLPPFSLDEDLPGTGSTVSEGESRWIPDILQNFMGLTLDKLISRRTEPSQSETRESPSITVSNKDEHGGASTISTPEMRKLLAEASPPKGVLEGSHFGLVTDRILNDRIQLWNSLETKITNLKSDQTNVEEKQIIHPVDQTTLIKSLYFMGDFILRNGMMPPEFIDNIQIFKLETLQKMIEYHIELQFEWFERDFFDHLLKLCVLTDSTIEALSERDQMHVVYTTLKTIMRLAHNNMPGDEGQLSEQFAPLRHEFLQLDFLAEVDSLSSRLSDRQDAIDLHNFNNLPIVILLDYTIQFFQNPLINFPPGQTRIEFQLVYFILDFTHRYYRPLLDDIVNKMENPLGSALFEKQFKYISSWFNWYRSKDQDPSVLKQPDPSFFEIADDNRRDYVFRQWVDRVTIAIFRHDDTASSSFNLWMKRPYSQSFHHF